MKQQGAGRGEMGTGTFSTARALLTLLGLVLAPIASPQEPFPGAGPSSPDLGALDRATLDDRRRAEIARAFRERDYDRAETLLVQAIERQPQSPELLRLLGGVSFVKGHALNAAIAFKKAEALEPLDESSRFTLAMSYVALGKRDWARPELGRLKSTAPRNALYSYWLSRLDYDEGQYATAVQGFLHTIELDPGFTKAHDNLGLSYEALGRFDEAVRSYQAAVRVNREQQSKWPWPALNLGLLLSRLDRPDEAEPLFREALRDDPRFPQGHYQLGVLLERSGRLADAVASLEEAARLDPAYPEPRYALARVYRRRGEADRADRALAEFQRLKKEKGQTGPGPR